MSIHNEIALPILKSWILFSFEATGPLCWAVFIVHQMCTKLSRYKRSSHLTPQSILSPDLALYSHDDTQLHSAPLSEWSSATAAAPSSAGLPSSALVCICSAVQCVNTAQVECSCTQVLSRLLWSIICLPVLLLQQLQRGHKLRRVGLSACLQSVSDPCLRCRMSFQVRTAGLHFHRSSYSCLQQ